MTTPLPVLMVSSHAQRGGSETYLLHLVERLGARVEPYVVALEDGPFVDAVRTAGIDHRVIATGRRVGLARSAVALRRAVAAWRPAVVHANGVKAATVAALALVGRRESLLWVKHDHSWDGLLGRWVARRADLVVGVSESALTAVHGHAATRVVPPGVVVDRVDVGSSRQTLRRLVGADADDPVLVVVGRLDPAKRYDIAIDVLARVRASMPSARLAIVGGEDPRHPGTADGLRARAATRGVADAVALLGHRDDAQSLVAGADVALVTSLEGFGLVAVEALALGTPVVGFAVGATPEVVGDAGVLVPAGDVEGFAAAVLDVLADPSVRTRLVEAGRRRARAFDVDVWAETMYEVYDGLAGWPRATR